MKSNIFKFLQRISKTISLYKSFLFKSNNSIFILICFKLHFIFLKLPDANTLSKCDENCKRA